MHRTHPHAFWFRCRIGGAWTGIGLRSTSTVYFGDDPRGGMGAYGHWNVGNWCDDVQDRYIRTLI